MRRSDALRRWRTAFFAARACRNGIADEGVGARAERVATYYADLDQWTAEQDRLYSLLTPEHRAAADRIKETT